MMVYQSNLKRRRYISRIGSEKAIQYGHQHIDRNDREAVINTLTSPFLTQGPKTVEFENALAKYCGATYAVVVNSGTSALHISCLAAGIGVGDEVITSPITFVASANCALYCGGTIVFADIDSLTHTISPEEIEKRVTKRTKAIIPVHFAGQSCDMEEIVRVVRSAEKKTLSSIRSRRRERQGKTVSCFSWH